ncbi:MAG: hypothetical protein KF819_19400 [Labilithrix sp.]|nr:hypothetical protein [Labilithrix sp.]
MKFPPFSAEKPKAPPPEAPRESVAPSDPKPAAAPPECATEAEPNDDVAQATKFTKCIKGALTTWTDKDSLAITAPSGVTAMIVDNAQPDGVIKYAVTTPQGEGGQSNFNMSFTDKAPRATITPGLTYVFQLTWDNNGQGSVSGNRSYTLRVAFE